MATVKLIYTSVFLLAIIFSHGVISTEGRQLRTQLNKKCAYYLSICENNPNGGNNLNLRRGILDLEADPKTPVTGDQSASVGTVEASSADDFRPTDPGHSPGAGHGAGPGRAGSNQ